MVSPRSLRGSADQEIPRSHDTAVIDAIVRASNAEIRRVLTDRDSRAAVVKAEILQLEVEAGNLIRFISRGGISETVAEQLRNTEGAPKALRSELAELDGMADAAVPVVHRTWVMSRLDRLHDLLKVDVWAARAEIAKHLDGDLLVRPLPARGDEKRAEVLGRVRPNSLLAAQEAVCLQVVVAGAGFERATFGL